MLITFEPALPCAQYLNRDTRLCEQLTNSGVITPTGGDVVELLPVCAMHLNELLLSVPAPSNEALAGYCPN